MIRKSEISDIERILEIEEQCFPKTPFSKIEFLYYSHFHPNTFLVYENENKILGYIIFTNKHVASIATDFPYRKKGIGTELMKEAIKRNKKLFLEVRESNINAIEFYKKLGFEITDIIHDYYGNENAYKMRLGY